MNVSKILASGEKIRGFLVDKAVEIDELKASFIELTHIKTSAKVIHIGNDDPENLFCLSFRTYPDTSNGVAHILEHTVLCGSKKFPVKDPFFAMTRRSLNTFMNALTGADFTCYPAATQVKKDFYNLLEVYLDAVFHPNLKQESFRQEGWRLEFSKPKDPTSALTFQGIVFNEMKGALASGSARLTEKLHAALFPDITYGINSGGEPLIIPKLSYQELLNFHQTFYHPSHCLFFFYGNLPLDKHLEFIEEKALSQAEKKEPLQQIPLQKRFLEPKRSVFHYPVGKQEDLEGKTLFGFGWLTCHILNQEELLALSILEIILLETDASVLKKALLKSGLCKQVSSYLDGEMREVPFILLLKGCDLKQAEAIEKVIQDTLKQVVFEGISLKAFENALHQLEIYRSEITGDSHPFGLSLFMRSALLWQHGADPLLSLKIHTLFDTIRKKNLQDPQYLTRLISKYLIENPHFVRIALEPDPHLEEKEAKEEALILDQLRKELTEDAAKNIVKETKRLADFQKEQAKAPLDSLPKVTLADVPPYVRDFPLKQVESKHLQVFHHPCFTNQIVYADLFFKLPLFKEENMPPLRLFSSLFSQLGCGGRSYAENLEFIQENTGGIGASLGIYTHAKDVNQFFPYFSLRGKALERKTDKLFQILQEFLLSLDLSHTDRIKEVILKQYTALESALQQNSLRYAVNLATSSLNLPAKIANDWYGLTYYTYLKKLVKNFDQEKKQLFAILEEFKRTLFGANFPHLVLSCSEQAFEKAQAARFYELGSWLPKEMPPVLEETYPLDPKISQGKVIASPVAFSCLAIPGPSYDQVEAAVLSVAANLFDHLVLHPKIREQGGAYGGGATCQLGSASFYFYSYRDPKIADSFQAYKEAVLEVASGNFSLDDLESAKLEVIQGLDSPVAPGSRALRAYGWYKEGKTKEVRQQFRTRLLNLTKEEVVSVVCSYLAPKMEEGCSVVFAGEGLFEKENRLLKEKGDAPFVFNPI